jgi:hypothetical protein
MCSQAELWLPDVCGMCQTIEAARADERSRLVGEAIWEITVDGETKMAYLWTVPDKVYARTDGLTTHRDAYLDIDASGRVVGIEIDNWPGSLRHGHKFVMDTEFEMCVYCGALLDTVSGDGIHWFRKEGDND